MAKSYFDRYKDYAAEILGDNTPKPLSDSTQISRKKKGDRNKHHRKLARAMRRKNKQQS